MTRFFIGLDLGQQQDFTALAVAERIVPTVPVAGTYPWQPDHPLHELWDPKSKPLYHLRHLQRFPLRTSYLDVVKQTKALLDRPELCQDCILAVDHTGVGIAVVNMLEEAKLPCQMEAVTIHGGDTVSRDGGHYRVPKRDLIGVTQVLLQSERLKIAEALPEAKTLVKELLDYRVKIDPTTAHDAYNAREGAHDDLVLAVALACWIGEKIGDAEPRVRWI